MEQQRLPLTGVKVIELCLAKAGPTCVRHLADWGADVIKVEALEATPSEDVIGKREGSDFQNLHRNKRSIRLNVKTAEGYAAFMKLVETADVLVENMRASVKYKLKVAWEDLQKINPRLVYGSLSGFGQSGPYSTRAGVDQIAQGMSGLMSVTGEPGRGPMRVGIPIGDLTAGNMLALGVMMALFDRERTGVGQWVHTSLLESLIFMMDLQAARWLVKQEVPGQVGNDHPTGIPTGVFPTSDGHITICAASSKLWLKLCDFIGKPEWKAKPEWTTQVGRSKDRKIIHDGIGEFTKAQTTAHWIQAFAEASIPCGPIYNMDQVFGDPQVQHIAMAKPVTHARLGEFNLVASPLNFSRAEKALRRPTPDGGEHTDEVMRELGYQPEDIEQLRLNGVVQ